MTGALPDPGAAFATPCAPPVSRSIRRVRAGLAKAAGRRLRTPLRGVRRVFGRHGAGSGGPQASIPLDAARAREIRGARRKFARIQSPIRLICAIPFFSLARVPAAVAITGLPTVASFTWELTSVDLLDDGYRFPRGMARVTEVPLSSTRDGGEVDLEAMEVYADSILGPVQPQRPAVAVAVLGSIVVIVLGLTLTSKHGWLWVPALLLVAAGTWEMLALHGLMSEAQGMIDQRMGELEFPRWIRPVPWVLACASAVLLYAESVRARYRSSTGRSPSTAPTHPK